MTTPTINLLAKRVAEDTHDLYFARRLIQEAKGGGSGKDWAYTQDHLDAAEVSLERHAAHQQAEIIRLFGPMVEALEAMLSEDYQLANVIALDQRVIPPLSAIETVQRIENQARKTLADLATEGGA